MKQLLHKVSSILLAIIVLFSTFSFTVDSHYCGETLVDYSIFSKAKSCSGNMMNSDSKELEFAKKSCCKNEVSIVEGKVVHQQELQKIEVEQLQFVTAFITSYTNLFTHKFKQNYALLLYDPPLVHKDVIVLFENFRI